MTGRAPTRASARRPLREEGLACFRPHPEEPCGARRLEGWIHGADWRPSFETRASKSAVADYDVFAVEIGRARMRAVHPSFETAATRPPQDEVEHSHALAMRSGRFSDLRNAARKQNRCGREVPP